MLAIWLVASSPLTKSVGEIIPNIWEKMATKPPTINVHEEGATEAREESLSLCRPCPAKSKRHVATMASALAAQTTATGQKLGVQQELMCFCFQVITLYKAKSGM